MQIADRRLFAQPGIDFGAERPLAGIDQPGLPFSLPAIEQQDYIPVFTTQDITQVISLIAVKSDLAVTAQRAIDIETRGAEIVARHGPIHCRRFTRRQFTLSAGSGRGLQIFARFAAIPTHSPVWYEQVGDRLDCI